MHPAHSFPLISLGLAFALSAEEVGFNADIRPLLSDHCFACHGFDANTREADLRLDTPEGAFALRDGKAAIVPGKPEESLAWQRIISKDPDDVMPPYDSHLKLDDEEKDFIKRWIEGGAVYEDHWAFQRVERPELPTDGGHPVDAFVGLKLAEEGLKFADEAPKRTLVRRLSQDLRGLPPSPEEVDAFLADDSDGAYERLVDRFLADPAYGERMAWPWLDAARYADSNGYQADNDRTMWPWRDWVIDAFNRNLPYDDFTVWQIAGDLLPEATDEQILATGFLRNHPINGEGGRIPEENRVDYVMDMTETVGTVWMGLTMNCARCHDHKYDPIKQSDYYSLFAFFNQTPINGAGGNPQTPPVIAWPSSEQAERESEMVAKLNELRSQAKQLEEQLLPKLPEWESHRIESLEDNSWSPLAFDRVEGFPSKRLEDGTLLATGFNPIKATYRLQGKIAAGVHTAIRIDAMRHPSMTDGGLARSNSGNFVLTGFKAEIIDGAGKKRPLEFDRAEATFEQSGFPVAHALDGKNETGWAVYGGRPIDRDHAAVFHLKDLLDLAEDAVIEVYLDHQSRHRNHVIGRLLVSVTDETNPSLSDGASRLAKALREPAESRSKESKELIRSSFLNDHPEYKKIESKVAATNSSLGKHRKLVPKVMVMADQKKRRKTHILAVGNYEKPLDPVPAATIEVLPPLSPLDRDANRLDLARWLVSRDHPLTARVTINRIWQDIFGIGLIKSPEDFGVQSEVPVHPELIDFLAAEFMESGWDLKRLVRTIVTSRTYRQSSRVTPELLELDPANRLLARGPRYRLPAWMIRDQALATSGRLVRKIGGRPVKPYQPDGLWKEATFEKKKYVQDKGDALYRRSLYTFWRRISAPPMFFDNASRDLCSVNPSLTNTPMHALATLNDPTYVEAARLLAGRSVQEASADPAAVLRRAFEIVHARPPSDLEMQVLEDAHRMARESFAEDKDAMARFLAVGDSPVDDSIEPLELAALSSVCLSILNTDEALTKE